MKNNPLAKFKNDFEGESKINKDEILVNESSVPVVYASRKVPVYMQVKLQQEVEHFRKLETEQTAINDSVENS